MARKNYNEVVVTTPGTIPYVRASIHAAHWFAARALRSLIEGGGLEKSAIDGLCFSSFTSVPDSAVGLTQHLGLSLRWLDHIPMGGAAGAFIGLTEAIRQVTRAPIGTQLVPEAKIGLASGFGMINFDRGVCCGAAILSGDYTDALPWQGGDRGSVN